MQHIYDGARVNISGYEFIARDLTQSYAHNGREYLWVLRFTGVCTDSKANDDIRNTGYNGGRYGGNHHAGYRWNANVTIAGNEHNQ